MGVLNAEPMSSRIKYIILILVYVQNKALS